MATTSDFFDIDQRRKLASIPRQTTELEIDGSGWAGWDRQPLTAAESKALSSLNLLEKLTLSGFEISPIPILELIPPDALTSLTLEYLPLDQAVIESLQRFPYITDLTLDLNTRRKHPPVSPVNAKPVCALHYLSSIRLQADFSDAAVFLEELSEVPLKALILTVNRLEPECLRAIASFTTLSELSIYAAEVAAKDFTILETLHGLRTLIMACGPTLPFPAVITSLRTLGMINIEEFQGQIGEWGESGKEEPAREFLPDGDWAFSLRGGDELTVIDGDGRILYQGILEDETGRYISLWTQKGIPFEVWDSWFSMKKNAVLRTWRTNPGYNVQLSSTLRPEGAI